MPAALLALLALAACGGAGAAAAEEDAITAHALDQPLRARTEGGCYDLELRAEPAPPALGELFAIVTTVRHAGTGALAADARVALDATMPQHGHGMVTRPAHAALGDGQHRSEGMKLHMPGRWVLTARVEGACVDEVAIPIEQPPAHARRAP